ncbi:leucyl/phenylalanyl-tRNA--protein transferase [Streptomyces sp. NPDC003023]|uniref:leucyl/phenylalanyl-tRNA--protein transferase n=1 Tax=Streptomyces sp. NPDC003023 TaxID=3364675 RepID=UPI00368D82FB
MLTTTLKRPASVWEQLDLASAPSEGPVAFGDDLRPQTLLSAYRHGLYPFPAETIEHELLNELSYEAEVAAGRIHVLDGSRAPFAVAWCSPDPRPLISSDRPHLSRSLRRLLRRTEWTTTLDTCFTRVVEHCRQGRSEKWLTDELAASLNRLHECGYAHSIEVWEHGELIGGTFGVLINGVFSADSQFTLRSGAGKVAVTDLCRRLAEAGGTAVDVQRDSDHVQMLGAGPVARTAYLQLLTAPGTVTLPTGPKPARRLDA